MSNLTIVTSRNLTRSLLRFTKRITRSQSTVSRQDANQTHEKLTWSYAHGASSEPLLGKTIGELLKQNAQEFREIEAVVDMAQDVRMTFEQVDAEVDQLAAGLISVGLEKGDRIGIWGLNSYQWYLTYLAAARAGLIAVTVNPANQVPEMKYCIDKVDMKAVVIDDVFKTVDFYDSMCKIAPELVHNKGVSALDSPSTPSLKTVISISKDTKPGTITWENVKQAGLSSDALQRLAKLEPEIGFDDPCNIQFTSGTTGKPKGATLSHHNVVNNAYFLLRKAEREIGQERICMPLPLFHCYANVIGLLGSVHYGSTVVLPCRGYEPEATMKALLKEKCTLLLGTPTMHIDNLRIASANPRPKSDYSLKMIASGGAICTEDTYKKLQETFPIQDMINGYGMTETSPATLCRPFREQLYKALKTIGPPLDHTEVKIVDENDNIVPVGTIGELCIRGYATMLGYWKDEEKTKEIMKGDRWLHTGDLFVMDEDGYCQVVGRSKDLIIRGGENIYPKEVEEHLHTHPDISEAYVFGVPDERLGEELGAWILMREGARPMTPEDVKKHCKGRLAHFKIPKYVHFTKEFPKTASGKVQKFKLQEMSKSIFNLS